METISRANGARDNFPGKNNYTCPNDHGPRSTDDSSC